MSPRRHLDDLFSAAYEDELTPIEEARFQSHIQTCAPCADAYAEFRSSIEALRGMPRVPMPHVVHLPSTPPVAERPPRPRIGLSWFNLGLLRRFPATAIAGVAAVAIVIVALAHGPGASTATSSEAPAPDAHGQGGAQGVATPASELSCVHSIVDITGATPPVSYSQLSLATNPAQPAVHLVLASPTLVVTPGKTAAVYAQLSVPVSSISNPGTLAAPASTRAVLPCVSITFGGSSQLFTIVPNTLTFQPGAPGAPSGSGSSGLVASGATGPLFTFVVPAGLPQGTEVHVKATVPAGFTGFESPPLTAELTLTTS